MSDSKSIEVTEDMVNAGLRILFVEYHNKFDPLENDARHFVTRLYLGMQLAQQQSHHQVAVVHELQSECSQVSQ